MPASTTPYLDKASRQLAKATTRIDKHVDNYGIANAEQLVAVTKAAVEVAAGYQQLHYASRTPAWGQAPEQDGPDDVDLTGDDT